MTVALAAAIDIDNMRSSRRGVRKTVRKVTEEHIDATRSKWKVLMRNLPDGPDTRVADIDIDLAEEYAANRIGRVRPQTFKRELMLLQRAVKYAREFGEITRERAHEILDNWPSYEDGAKDEARRGKYWAPDEIRIFIDALHQDAADEVAWCYFTGSRWKEMKRAQQSWVAPLPEPMLMVPGDLNGPKVEAVLNLPAEGTKGGKRGRSVPLVPQALAIVGRRVREHPGEFIFSRKNFRKHRESVAARLHKAKQLSRKMTPTLRDMRHSCCTELGRAGVDPRIIQAIMGHSSLEMTMIYWTVTPDKLAGAGLKLLEGTAPKQAQPMHGGGNKPTSHLSQENNPEGDDTDEENC